MLENPTFNSCAVCNIGCLKDAISDEEINLLNNNKVEIKYLRNDTILKQGTFVSEVMFLKKGIVKIVTETKNDKYTILKITTENSFICLPSISNIEHYPYSVVAYDNVTACFLRKDWLIEYIKQNKKVANLFLHKYSEDSLFFINRISLLNTRNNHGKLASALMYLYELSQKFDNIFNNITRKDLADLACISLESVNRILLELKHDCIIDIDTKSIKILQPKLIAKLSTVG